MGTFHAACHQPGQSQNLIQKTSIAKKIKTLTTKYSIDKLLKN